MIHPVKSFIVVNEAEVDVFLEFSCLFCDPVDIVNLISSSSAFPCTPGSSWFMYCVMLGMSKCHFQGGGWDKADRFQRIILVSDRQ